jgi:AcrR family transcriptional regulator
VRAESNKGRQTEATRNDQRVLEAARLVFATRGWDAPVAAIAAQAGVGMGSLYRRYGSKTELLQTLCVLSTQQSIDAATTALALEDPWEALRTYIEACVAIGVGAFAPLAGTIDVTEQMLSKAKQSHRLLANLTDRAHGSGQLRPDVTDTDIWSLIEQFSRRSANPDADEEPRARSRVLAIAVAGLSPQTHITLPGPPPNRHARGRRWSKPLR